MCSEKLKPLDSVSESSPSDAKKRGRPKGSKTQELDQVVDIPQGCPKCNSTEYKVLSTPRQRAMQGIMAGQHYNQITWRRCKCDGCQNVFMMRSYRNL